MHAYKWIGLHINGWSLIQVGKPPSSGGSDGGVSENKLSGRMVRKKGGRSLEARSFVLMSCYYDCGCSYINKS